MAIDLNTLNAVEIAAALQAGKTDQVTIVAHLASRKLGDSIADCVPLLPLMGDYVSAVLMSQTALHQAKVKVGGKSPIRRSSGSRNITVHPQVRRDDGKDGSAWQMTACRSAWRWVIAHADEISKACDDADKADAQTIATELAKKLQAEAAKPAK